MFLAHYLAIGLVLLIDPSFIAHGQDIASDPFNACASSELDAPEVWNTDRIQKSFTDLLNDDQFNNNVVSSYAIVYKDLVYWRDQERCFGSLQANQLLEARMNHLLSSTTTKLLLRSLKTCRFRDLDFEPTFGLCHFYHQVSLGNHDTLTVAAESAAIYLSSHLAISLASLVYHDPLWNDIGPFEVRGSAVYDPKVRAARIESLKAFKKTFDKYGRFLSQHLDQGVEALEDAFYVKGSLSGILARFVAFFPIGELALQTIRNRTFEVAVRYAEETQSPLLIQLSERESRINVDQMNFAAQIPDDILALEQWARRAVSNPGLRLIYRTVLGARTQRQLSRCDDGCCGS